MKLEINNRWKSGKLNNIWKLNNILLNNWVNKEITRKIREHLEMDENENTTYQKSMECS